MSHDGRQRAGGVLCRGLEAPDGGGRGCGSFLGRYATSVKLRAGSSRLGRLHGRTKSRHQLQHPTAAEPKRWTAGMQWQRHFAAAEVALTTAKTYRPPSFLFVAKQGKSKPRTCGLPLSSKCSGTSVAGNERGPNAARGGAAKSQIAGLTLSLAPLRHDYSCSTACPSSSAQSQLPHC